MRRVMVRYKVKAGQEQRNENLVRAVYDELHRRQPDGIRYATFKLDDDLTFVHVAETDPDHNPLTDLRAFNEFLEGIADRCDEPPATTELHEIGSFRLFTR
jgi:hypothetical protein